MSKGMKSSILVLLVLSALMFSVLIPGGPIETRNFSHIHPAILASFNIFLTTLGIGSLFAAYYVWKGTRGAILAAALCGFGYLVVYLLDLLTIFPVSSDAMPPMLWGIETAGTILSVPLTLLSVLAAIQSFKITDRTPSHAPTKISPWIGITVGLFALAIVIFATFSAMHK